MKNPLFLVGNLILLGLAFLAGVIIMPLLSKVIAKMQGKLHEEVKSEEEEARKRMLKTLRRYVILTIVIFILSIIFLYGLFIFYILQTWGA